MSAYEIKYRQNSEYNIEINLLQKGKQLIRKLKSRENRYHISINCQKLSHQQKQQYVNKLILYFKQKSNSNQLATYLYLLKIMNVTFKDLFMFTTDYNIGDVQCDINIYRENMPSLNCVSCSSYYIKKFKLTHEYYDSTPFLLTIESQLKLAHLSKLFCSLLNGGGGSILIISNKIDYQNNTIYNGFQREKSLQPQKLLKKLYQACNQAISNIYYIQKTDYIKHVQATQNIHLQIQFIPLMQSLINQSNYKQFVIRIIVCEINKNKQVPLFYVSKKQQKFEIYVLKANYNENKFKQFSIELIQGQKIYKYLKKSSKRKRKIIRCECLNPTNQKRHQIMNYLKKITQPQPDKQQVSKTDSHKKPQFIWKQFYLFQDHYNNLQKYHSYLLKQFSRYSSNFNPQTIVLFQFKNSHKLDLYKSEINKMFEQGKIRFNNYIPIPQYQQFLSKPKKNLQYNQSTIFHYQVCIFQGRYDHFINKLKKVLGLNYVQNLSVYFILPSISIGNTIQINDLALYQNLMKNTFNVKPKIQKQNVQSGVCKRVKIQFSKKQLPFAVFTFLFMLICKKRPKCQ